MATSSSDESCSATTDFDGFLEDSHGKFNSIYERCPLCTQSKRAYYCKDCIRNGDFKCSKYGMYAERFADKKMRLFEVTKDKLLLLDRINASIQKMLKIEELKTSIETCQTNMGLLKKVVKETRETVANAKSATTVLNNEIGTQKISLQKKKDKKIKMQQHIKGKQHLFRNQLTRLVNCHRKLKSEKRRNVTWLVKNIFPVSRVYPEESQDDSSVGETVSALAEASRMAYMRGRWVYMDKSGDMQYRIVEPLLPGSGDYSAYNVRVALSRESHSVASESGHRNPGSAISAALTYTCQFVSILAFYMDVLLPKKLCYSEFCSHEMNEADFACKVAKLNANVLHLCLSQSINPEILHPNWTAANLLLLLDPKVCDLGRYGPIDVNVEVMKSMEKSLLHDMCRDDDDEDYDSFCEWETISELPAPLHRFTASAIPYGHQYECHLPGSPAAAPSEGSTSIAGGLAMTAAASLASLWRGTFGTK